MSEEDVMSKVDNMLELTDSQKDRQAISNLVRRDLLDFLQGQIQRVNSGGELRKLVEKQLKDRIAPEDEEAEGLSDGALLKLYEVISANEASLSGKILELFKETQKIIIQTNPSEQSNVKKQENMEFTKDEVQSTKKLLELFDFVKEMKKTEFTEEEKN